jgi:hypothetical protein
MIVANKNKIKNMAENLSENGAGRSLWKDARLRFIQNKAATFQRERPAPFSERFSAIFLILFLLATII